MEKETVGIMRRYDEGRGQQPRETKAEGIDRLLKKAGEMDIG